MFLLVSPSTADQKCRIPIEPCHPPPLKPPRKDLENTSFYEVSLLCTSLLTCHTHAHTYTHTRTHTRMPTRTQTIFVVSKRFRPVCSWRQSTTISAPRLWPYRGRVFRWVRCRKQDGLVAKGVSLNCYEDIYMYIYIHVCIHVYIHNAYFDG